MRYEFEMAEPISTAGGAAAIKLGSMVTGAVLATIVVMVFTQPQRRGEWAVSLISTVLASLCGGSAIILKFGLQDWASDFYGVFAVGGVYFTAGLPGWILVRALFAWFALHRDSTLPEIIRAAKKDSPL